MSEHTFHFPTPPGAQSEPLFRGQQLPGSTLQAPIVPTEVDLAVALPAGALGFEGAVQAVQTAIAVNMDRKTGWGGANILMVQRQQPVLWAREAVAGRVVGEVFVRKGSYRYLAWLSRSHPARPRDPACYSPPKRKLHLVDSHLGDTELSTNRPQSL